jgi:hypothetical protein
MLKKYLLFALAVGLVSIGNQAVTAQQVNTMSMDNQYQAEKVARFGSLITVYSAQNIQPGVIEIPGRGLLELTVSNTTDRDVVLKIPMLNREEEVDAGETDVLTLDLKNPPAQTISYHIIHHGNDAVLKTGQISLRTMDSPLMVSTSAPGPQQQSQQVSQGQQTYQQQQQTMTGTRTEEQTGRYVRGYW